MLNSKHSDKIRILFLSVAILLFFVRPASAVVLPSSLEVDGTTLDDILEITATDSNSGSFVLTSDGVAGPSIPFSAITELTFNASDGDDRLIINHPGGDLFAPANGITYNGDGAIGDLDDLVLTGGTATQVSYTFSNPSDGIIDWDGTVLTYTGLEPITDNLNVADRVFTFDNTVDETITLSDAAAAGQSMVDLDQGESVTFTNPTNSLTLQTNGAIITGNSLEGRIFTGNFIGNIADGTGTGGLLGGTPLQTQIITGKIKYDNDNDFRFGDVADNVQGFSGLTQNDNYASLFIGDLNLPDLNSGNPYNVEFGTNQADDEVKIYVDLDQDGFFEDTNEGAATGSERVVRRGCCGSSYITISIGPGTYKYAVAHREGGGGSRVEPTIDLTLDGLGRRNIEPGTMGGLFTTIYYETGMDSFNLDGLDAAFDADLIIKGDSEDTVNFQTNPTSIGSGDYDIDGGTINVNTAVSTTGAGNMALDALNIVINSSISTVNGDLNVTTTSSDVTGNSSGALATTSGTMAVIAGNTINYAGSINVGTTGGTFNLSASNGVMSGVIAGAGTVTKSGNGTLLFSGANTFTGQITIADGELRVGHQQALGNPSGDTFVNSGGTLKSRRWENHPRWGNHQHSWQWT